MICFSWVIHILRVVVHKKGISHATTQRRQISTTATTVLPTSTIWSTTRRRQTSTTATTVLPTSAAVRPTIPAATHVSTTSTKEEEQNLALDCSGRAGRAPAWMHRHRGSGHIRSQNDKHWHG